MSRHHHHHNCENKTGDRPQSQSGKTFGRRRGGRGRWQREMERDRKSPIVAPVPVAPPADSMMIQGKEPVVDRMTGTEVKNTTPIFAPVPLPIASQPIAGQSQDSKTIDSLTGAEIKNNAPIVTSAPVLPVTNQPIVGQSQDSKTIDSLTGAEIKNNAPVITPAPVLPVADSIASGQTSGNDIIWGGAGNDTINGGDGDDTLGGNAGDDTISGGTGTDAIYGGDGNDTISGGDGMDFILGDGGDDTLNGDAGDDRLFGGTGADRLYGGAGNDSLSGEEDDDLLDGSDGDDRLYGGAGKDILIGGNGNDWLVSGSGNDTLTGGVGNDVFAFDRTFGSIGYDANTVGTATITDFTKGEDTIGVSSDLFGGFGYYGQLVASDFASVTNDAEFAAAAIGSAKIIYNSTDGGLFFNANGAEAGLGAGSQFATVKGAATLSHSDIQVQF
jgi:Ca2+-binding RTX toxin-like protein